MYPPIISVTPLEMCCDLVLYAIGLGLLARIVVEMGTLLATASDSSMVAIYKEKTEQIYHFCKENKLPPELQLRVVGYFRHYWSTRLFIDEREFLRRMSGGLRLDIM